MASSLRHDRSLPPMPSHYRDLFVWRKGMELARLAYSLAARLPPDDEPLAEDLRESAIGIPVRIAAGHWSDQLRRYIRAVDAAHGKVARVECLLDIGESLELLRTDDAEVVKARELCAEISRMLSVLMTTLRIRDGDSPAE
jgi:four helix bundle protein